MERRVVAPAFMLTDARGHNRKSRSLTREKAGSALGGHQLWRGSSAWRERAIANRQVGGSSPLPATIFINETGCPVLSALGNRNRQTREGQADYT